MIPLLVELSSVPAVKSIISILTHNEIEEIDIEQHLDEIVSCLENMSQHLGEMHRGCCPKLFYKVHRPLLSGWRDNPLLPDGLVYEGVQDSPLQYSGGSAAQSCILQIMDAAFGVKHNGREGEFLVRMRDYMPPNQRGLLNWVLNAPSLRTICEQRAKNKPGILEKFNNCVLALANFRTQHLILVSRYITSQANSERDECGI